MSPEVAGIALACGVLVVIIVAFLMGVPIPGVRRKGTRSHLARMVGKQQKDRAMVEGDAVLEALYASGEVAQEEKRLKTSQLTLDRRLRFAQWKIPPLLFRSSELFISAMAFYLVSQHCNRLMTVLSLLTGPLFMHWLLNLFVDRRFMAFDKDYPAFLMSLVSLLKTGMNVMTAIEVGAKGMEEGSLVREELLLMLDRLRYGVAEEKSIGSFGEDIYHPEIELFVQALLLSRRVGGTLSDTLDRLARQVRRRQQFRNSARAAVGMQRGSIFVIVGIMVAMEVYLYITYPQAVTGAIEDEIGWQVWQFGITAILLGIYWVRQVTKIRV